MRIEIFKVPPRLGEWAPSGPAYAFRPPTGDVGVYAVVESPPGWMLVGEPEPLLVLRTGSSDFTTRTATEVFDHALLGAEGFALAEPPADRAGRGRGGPPAADVRLASQPARDEDAGIAAPATKIGSVGASSVTSLGR